MSRALSPNFALPPLTVAPSGRGLSLESRYATKEELCSLVIEAGVDGRQQELTLRYRQVCGWHLVAAQRGASLVVLYSGKTIELFSTQHDCAKAWTYPLNALSEWSQLHPEFGQLKVTSRRGAEAAAHLFANTARLGSKTSSELRGAIQLACRTGTAGSAVLSLFQRALEVGQRVGHETLEGSTAPSESLREMAEICGARIVEEELLFWKSEQRNLYRGLSRRDAFLRKRQIPVSMVRMGSTPA